MRDVLAAIFWIWLLVALGVYGYRIYRRVSGGGKASTETDGAPPLASTIPPPSPTAPTAPPAPLVTPPPEASPAPPAGPGPVPAPPPATSGPPVTSPPPAGQEEGGRRGLFAPRPAEPDPSTSGASGPGGEPKVTVADAVAGISLPCDLAPLVGGESRIDPYRVVFFTDRADAGTVGAALGDELERLGYALTSTSDTEALATRPDATIVVSIAADTAAYPTAPEGSVVVVLST